MPNPISARKCLQAFKYCSLFEQNEVLFLPGIATMKDPIVEEVRKIREEHAARFGNDLRAIYEDLKRAERQSGRTVVSLPPKRQLERHGT